MVETNARFLHGGVDCFCPRFLDAIRDQVHSYHPRFSLGRKSSNLPFGLRIMDLDLCPKVQVCNHSVLRAEGRD